ncbi:protein FAR1-RELATED SEQUENCE 5-like [Lycium ferocissimum]|uniref:protein FAR1-RELATED SEQUENCE 5-like n=1 Tax=Lycium ferocissimum TaxID=112874 RepID=UPI0028149ABA|nr:protein FAR1-RELATED SEQUENCE 5-like [Lycium ferocissimum]
MGSSDGHCFYDDDQGSDDDTFQNFSENAAKKDGIMLHSGNGHVAMNSELIFIESATSSSHMEIVEPFTGMTFSSLEDARDFYYEYAKRTGFTIRTNRIRHSLKNMAVIGRDFVCSREGFRAAKHALRKDRVLPPKPVTREGCKAMIRLAARDGGKWVVTKFVAEHNHKLMTSSKFSGQLPTINILSEEEKDKKIQELHEELQQERERSETFRQQLCTIIKDLEEHAEFMNIRVEDIVKNIRKIELGYV